MSLLIRNATVLTADARDRVIEDGAVFVEDGRVAAVGPTAAGRGFVHHEEVTE